MALFHESQNQEHALQGNHMIGLSTPSRGARDVEVWRGRMDAGAATPPHWHTREEVVVILAGSGRATVDDTEVHYQAGDTLILPAGKVHQIFATTATELLAAMPIADPISLPDGQQLNLPWRA